MQYLTLNFRNAGLFPCLKWKDKNGILKSSTTKNLKTIIDIKNGKFYQSSSYEEFEGCDTDYIIGINQISNLMHILVGLPACPTKRKTIFNRNEDIFNLIKNNTYIKYDSLCEIDDLGNISGKEVSTSRKAVENSNSKIYMNININNNIKKINGYYTWDYIKRGLGLENFNIIYTFLCQYFNDKKLSSHKTFVEIIEEISKNYNDIKLINFLNNNKNLFKGNSAICGLIFGTKFTGYNTDYSKRTPLTVVKGINDKVSFDGTIVIKIDEKTQIGANIIEALKINTGTAKLLEGGFVNIKSLSKFINIDDLNTNYTKLES